MIQSPTGQTLTSQCVRAGTSVTLCCPVEEGATFVFWSPNQINSHTNGHCSLGLKVTFPSGILSDEEKVVWCDYEEIYNYAIILKSGMFNL